MSNNTAKSNIKQSGGFDLNINKLSETPKMIDMWGYESKNFNVNKTDLTNLISLLGGTHKPFKNNDSSATLSDTDFSLPNMLTDSNDNSNESTDLESSNLSTTVTQSELSGGEIKSNKKNFFLDNSDSDLNVSTTNTNLSSITDITSSSSDSDM
jgi:hypothetical protein